MVLRGRPLAERFAALVGPEREDGCRLWQGRVDAQGYGKLQVRKREYLAHRVALALALGRELVPEELALHSCAQSVRSRLQRLLADLEGSKRLHGSSPLNFIEVDVVLQRVRECLEAES